jgi:hypothetical protein
MESCIIEEFWGGGKERTRVGSGWGPSASQTARAAAVEGAQTSEKPPWEAGCVVVWEIKAV